MAAIALAEPYRLGPGDLIEVDHSGIHDPLTLRIDADGDIRLATIGGVSVHNQTLDQAEAEIARVMVDEGFFVNPAVSLVMRDYAPVVVGGDVINPGRFDYVPGMTVASALALSGGGQAGGLTRTEIARARADAAAGVLIANLDIALAVARMARFEAVLAGPAASLSVDTTTRRRIPFEAEADLAGILRNEANVLASDRARSADLLQFWEDEIATIEAQRQNFDARIAVQQDIVASTVEGLEVAQELSDRGLQTASRLVTAEQRAGDARSRVLELEAAKIEAARAISEAKRERAVFLANQEQAALLGLQEAGRDLETAAYRFQRFHEQGAALATGLTGPLVDESAQRLAFVLQTQRANRPTSEEITKDTVIMPGEVLIVSVVPLVDDLEG